MWRLAGPIILSNVSVPLLGAVDTAVVGHLQGAHNIGAVAVGVMAFSVLFWGFGFLRMGTSGLAAQALGAGDGDEVRAVLGRALLLGGLFSIALIVLQGPASALTMAMMEPGPAVRPLAETYFTIRIWGAPAALANFALLGWFIGTQNTKAPLYVQVALNGVNIGLDLLFVLGFGWGVDGVAWATLIAEWSALLFWLWPLLTHLKRLGGRWSRPAIVDAARHRRLLAINSDIFLRTLCLQASFVIFMRMGAAQGDLVLAANAVLFNFQAVMSYALDAFAHAASSLTGHALGRGDRARFRRAVIASGRWALLFALLYGAAYLLAGPALIAVMTDIPAVRAEAGIYLPWLIASPLVSVWSYHLDGIFIGATRVSER